MTNRSASVLLAKSPGERRIHESYDFCRFNDNPRITLALPPIEKTFEESRIHINWCNSVWNLNRWKKLEEINSHAYRRGKSSCIRGLTQQALPSAYCILQCMLCFCKTERFASTSQSVWENGHTPLRMDEVLAGLFHRNPGARRQASLICFPWNLYPFGALWHWIHLNILIIKPCYQGES